MEKTFDGQTVLITGGAGGFGRSAARKFAERGANLVLTDMNQEGLEDAKAALQRDGFRVEVLNGDITDEGHSQAAVELALSAFGYLDIAINNAGYAHSLGRVADLNSAECRKSLDINVMGVFFGMKYQLPAMVAAFDNEGRHCSVLNVASLAGIGGAPMMAMYAAAKHAVVGLTKSASLEYVRKGIRINALCPAFARTDMVTKDQMGGQTHNAEIEAQITRGIPMRRLAEPDEITQAMIWISDPANSFMTGQAVALDGGTSAM